MWKLLSPNSWILRRKSPWAESVKSAPHIWPILWGDGERRAAVTATLRNHLVFYRLKPTLDAESQAETNGSHYRGFDPTTSPSLFVHEFSAFPCYFVEMIWLHNHISEVFFCHDVCGAICSAPIQLKKLLWVFIKALGAQHDQHLTSFEKHKDQTVVYWNKWFLRSVAAWNSASVVFHYNSLLNLWLNIKDWWSCSH